MSVLGGIDGTIGFVTDSKYAVVYAESLRAIESQQEALESTRARAGQLLGAGSLVTSVLGGLVHTTGSRLHAGAWVALASFAALLLISIWIYVPRKGWHFVNSATDLVSWIEHFDASLDEMHRDLALRMEQHWDKNQDPLNQRMTGLQAGAVLLVISIVAWLVDLLG